MEPGSLLRRVTEQLYGNQGQFNQGQAAQVAPPEQIIAPAAQMILSNEEYRAKIDQERKEKYKNVVVVIDQSKFPERLRNLPNISALMSPSVYDLPDNYLLDGEGYFLEEMSNEMIIEMGRKVIPMLCIVCLFLLAYNLFSTSQSGGRAIEDALEPDNAINDFDPDTADNTIYNVGMPYREISSAEFREEEALYYCYIAASLLRLFTKSPENYEKAWSHINSNFSRFYGKQVPVLMGAPSLDVLRALHCSLNSSQRYKVTLFKFLYYSSSSKDSEGLKYFLYGIHLSNTGVHIVNIFLRLCVAYDAVPGLFIALFKGSRYEKQFVALERMIKLIVSKDDVHSRKMWTYARIFEQNFMSELQTKACPKLVYILALALKRKSPSDNANILNIVQFNNISDADKKRLEISADLLTSELIKSQQGRQ